MKKWKKAKGNAKEDSHMVETVVKVDNNMFNQFLQANKEKINLLAPKNPSIAKDDEWRQEDFWDTDEEGK